MGNKKYSVKKCHLALFSPEVSGKSEVGNVSFPLIAPAVGNFPTIYPPLSIPGDFPKTSSSVGKFPTVTEIEENFLLLSVHWKIFYRTNVVANQRKMSLDHRCSGKFSVVVNQ